MRNYASNLAFIDMVLNLLLGFIVLFILAFLYINPIADTGKIDPVTQFMITMQWDDKSSADMDLWVRGPDGTVVGYQHKDGSYIYLDRDDLGLSNDTVEIDGKPVEIFRNIETVSITKGFKGEYIVNVNFFPTPSKIDNKVEEVQIDLYQMNPYKLVISKKILLSYAEEKTAFSFIVDENSNISDISEELQIKIKPRPNKE